MARARNGSGIRARRTRRRVSPLIFLSFAACAKILDIPDVPSGDSELGRAAKSGEQAAGSAGLAPVGGSPGGGEAGDAAGGGGRSAGKGGGGRSAGKGGGSSGNAGTNSAGRGEAGAGEGGAGDGGAGAAGAGEGGAASSGGGAGQGGTASGGGANGGTSGGTCVIHALEEGLSEGTERLGAECDDENRMACSDASASLILQCLNGVWAEAVTCDSSQRCNRKWAECLSVDEACLTHIADAPFCDGSDAIDCEYQLYRPSRRHCPYGCRAGACLPGGPGDLTLHTGEGLVYDGVWQEPIPVCVRGSGDEALVAIVKDEVERTWSRFLSVSFAGFGPCADDGVVDGGGGNGGSDAQDEGGGVVLSFVDGCHGELVNDVNIGKPDDGHAISLQICKSYCDVEAGPPKVVEPNLLRLLARHQFGHLIGLYQDGHDARETMMVRGVRLEDVDDLVARWGDYTLTSYGPKHASALVTPRGECIAASGSNLGSGIRTEFCGQYGDDLDSWVLLDGQLQAYGLDDGCIAPSPDAGDELELSSCSLGAVEDGFHMSRVQWRTPLDCVGVDSVESGAVLRTEPCEPLGAASQAWKFEVVGVGGNYLIAQIRLADSGYCVEVPRPERLDSDVLALKPCAERVESWDDLQAFLMVMGGSIRTVARYSNGTPYFPSIQWQRPSSVLHLLTRQYADGWTLSGAVEYGTDRALTEEHGKLALRAFENAPLPNQVFDLHF